MAATWEGQNMAVVMRELSPFQKLPDELRTWLEETHDPDGEVSWQAASEVPHLTASPGRAGTRCAATTTTASQTPFTRKRERGPRSAAATSTPTVAR